MNTTLFILLQITTTLAVLGTLAAIVQQDATAHRIPNPLVLAGLVAALAWHGLAPAGAGLFDRHLAGSLGLGQALAGGAIAFGVFLVMHLLRTMGAGDVKLMGFAGTVFGLPAVGDLLLLVLLSGGLLAGWRLIDGPRRRKAFGNIGRILAARRLSGGTRDDFDPARDTADRLPYAIAIATGVLILATSQHLGVALPWSAR